ncbi:hypothetical protein MMYC01_205325 [Madurella mycetomatis]|uniref:Uncharacterized protein n=1 Tax=Madurella mycetomatis TaxID=100816 RepID=A0A175VXN8_9PEZI|nr:hypothetical protein MMYC01_205325 [Madurella mycetomatis]
MAHPSLPARLGPGVGSRHGREQGSKKALDIIRGDMVTDSGFLPAFIKAVHPALSNGAALDALNGEAHRVFTASLDEIVARGPRTVKLFEWIRHKFLMATTDSVYSPRNWGKFHPAIMFLMLDLLPPWAFRSAINARNRLAKSFQD